MATAGIIAGSTGNFVAQLLDNGEPIALPDGSSFVWAADDSNVTIEPSADTTSAVVSVPGSDTGGSFNLTVSAKAPDGSTATSEPLNVQIAPEPHQFTVQVSQVAASV